MFVSKVVIIVIEMDGRRDQDVNKSLQRFCNSHSCWSLNSTHCTFNLVKRKTSYCFSNVHPHCSEKIWKTGKMTFHFLDLLLKSSTLVLSTPLNSLTCAVKIHTKLHLIHILTFLSPSAFYSISLPITFFRNVLHFNSIRNSACVDTRQNCRTFLVSPSFVMRCVDRPSAPSVFGDSAERSAVPSQFIWLFCSLSRGPTWHFSLALTPSNKLSEWNSVLRLDSHYAIRRQLGSPGKSSIKSWSEL